MTVRKIIITLQSKLVGEIKKVKNEHTQLFINIMLHDIKAALENIKVFSHLLKGPNKLDNENQAVKITIRL